MIFIENTFVEEQILEANFHCNIKSCKGICCVEGDFGAPLDEEEIIILESIYSKIETFISRESKAIIKEKGTSVFYKSEKFQGTPLLSNGACVYAIVDMQGVVACGIEKAYYAGVVKFKKPLSCELYPIRIEKNPINGFDTLRYDEWDICKEACTLGKKEQIKIYQFLEEAITRKYGEEYYKLLSSYANRINL